jgi:hypothetical protein
MYSRPTEPTMEWIDAKFAGRELIIAANKVAYGRATHLVRPPS